MLQFLVDKGYLKHDEKSLYTTFLASSFRTLRFGLLEAHGKGMAVQFNYLTDKGAFVYRNGVWEVDAAKIKGAVRDLAHDLLTIEATGDYAGAKQMFDKLAMLRPDAAATIARMNDLPVDIRASFVTADALAPGGRALSQPRIVVGITGATGSMIGVRLLEVMRDAGRRDAPHHEQVGRADDGSRDFADDGRSERAGLARTYSNDQGAAVSSGSFLTDGMVIAPCSMRTLAAIASGPGRTSGAPRRGRHPERAPKVSAGGAGIAAKRDPSGKYAETGAHGGNYSAADAGIL